jgi:SAM-dependent methyltransferase
MQCRFCGTPLSHVFIDLFNSPPSNAFLTEEQLNEPELFFPLKVYTCDACFLVQIDEYQKSDAIFDNKYVYFSSFSSSWLEHARKYTIDMRERFGLNEHSQVIEIASNDGYLLQYFVQAGIPVLGVEPTANTAEAARKKGIPSITEFFGTALARRMLQQGTKADLLLGNNVLAHVPDIVDFVRGMKLVLKENGVITMEFPHLMQLMENNQFDTIYHEHFSYLSFTTVSAIFKAQGLVMFDVEELPTHGGSLRIYARHAEDATKPIGARVGALLDKEASKGMNEPQWYDGLQQQAFKIKLDLLDFLRTSVLDGKRISAYGAAAKGNTLLNYCGIRSDLLDFVVDANPDKQNKYLPASHIPVVNEDVLRQSRPDYVMILPWNLREEITRQLSYIRQWNGKFIVAIPALEVW